MPLLTKTSGTVLVVVNSICGCAAGRARPAVAMALENKARPEVLATVFAGQDTDATTQARSYFTGYPPSSPSIALLRDGKLVFMLERKEIEGRDPYAIAEDLDQGLRSLLQSSQRRSGELTRCRCQVPGVREKRKVSGVR